MLQLRTRLKPADNCGAKSLEIMHIYVGSKHKQAGIGDIVLAVVKEAMPNGLVKKKEKVKVVIVRTKKELGRTDGSYIRFSDNAGVIIDSQKNPRGTRIFGPIAREIKDAGFTKIASMAKEVY
ncbi:MAG: 50S ribosomal protein L14 [Candidatus Shapirobacteria bacterium GW2011_GWE1_38_10]|uniref:Large ribosomal subunit protein uL14 n=1 Tax=Candidatus Shapirobacteria bacterium GW2011_GWE1_38_10 TaxID=1618488 RepID=A0A0G0LBY4_9BACT|nr:MAG: 50S ribosomal protein L14 [Candidatus Shapirobacteria bacterium GW2011_GWF2_37_20]KKQ50151.1 MAG: 50S ribosomal protein L14 [Candidatus Shapirobacteria bacterium GW2011_GWE1_38_10]KKQ64744.1 MAG: 50S ribosomal protein L14 [Candidatus Shapirobacteria bacterium GW2011_GWF1_38_23]HBP50900.1 50S ribosomal protein L14 [Candidatus Shapirobacteria bacterium]